MWGFFPVQASELIMYTDLARVNASYNSDDIDSTRDALLAYMRASNKFQLPALKQSVMRQRDIIYQNYKKLVERCTPPFLDGVQNANVFDGEFYKNLADMGDIRGTRLYGEYLLAQNDSAGATWVMKSAGQGDARAAFLVAEFYAYCMHGYPYDANLAYQWLQSSARAGYAPAWEQLAAIHWDADALWNAGWNKPYAFECIKSAVAGYQRWTLSSPLMQQKFQEHCQTIQFIQYLMSRYVNTNNYNSYEGFYPSFLAMRLSCYKEDDFGLRARMYFINDYMVKRAARYHIDGCLKLDLSMIPICLRWTDRNALGTVYSPRSKEKVSCNIQIYAEKIPNSYDDMTKWRREETLNSTIAHELAHCYFLARYYEFYVQYASQSKSIVEGHAVNSDFSFVKDIYRGGSFSPEQISAIHSKDYASYFLWYYNNILDANKLTNWSKLDELERNLSPTHTVSPIPVQEKYDGKSFEKPVLFGNGFYGYL